MTLDNILEEIKKANTIAIVVHENPDGDAIGSALAMKLALEQLNKEADVNNTRVSKCIQLFARSRRNKERI